MLRIQAVKGSSTEAQLFGEDDLAKRLPSHDVEMIREIFNTSPTGAYKWGYETANSKIRPKFKALGVLQFENLQHDGRIDWATLKAPLMRGGEVIMA